MGWAEVLFIIQERGRYTLEIGIIPRLGGISETRCIPI